MSKTPEDSYSKTKKSPWITSQRRSKLAPRKSITIAITRMAIKRANPSELFRVFTEGP